MNTRRTPARSRALFVQRLYDLSQANPNVSLDVKQIIDPLHLSESEIDACLQYALQAGWLLPHFTWGRGKGFRVSITPKGISKAEEDQDLWATGLSKESPILESETYPEFPEEERVGGSSVLLGAGWTRSGAQPGDAVSMGEARLTKPFAEMTSRMLRQNVLLLGEERQQIAERLLALHLRSEDEAASGLLVLARTWQEVESVRSVATLIGRGRDIITLGSGDHSAAPLGWLSPSQAADAIFRERGDTSANSEFFRQTAKKTLHAILTLSHVLKLVPTDAALLGLLRGEHVVDVPAQDEPEPDGRRRSYGRGALRLRDYAGYLSAATRDCDGEWASHCQQAASMFATLADMPEETRESTIATVHAAMGTILSIRATHADAKGASAVLRGKIVVLSGEFLSKEDWTSLSELLLGQLSAAMNQQRNLTEPKRRLGLLALYNLEVLAPMLQALSGANGGTGSHLLTLMLGAHNAGSLLNMPRAEQSELLARIGSFIATPARSAFAAQETVRLLACAFDQVPFSAADLQQMAEDRLLLLGEAAGPEQPVRLVRMF